MSSQATTTSTVNDLQKQDPLVELHELGADLLLLGLVNSLGPRFQRSGEFDLRRPRDFLDRNVKAVLINIFGGILRCDVLAHGVIAAVRELGVPVPIVIRMEGTNVDEGKRLLRESRMNFATADSMDEAAKKVVQLAA